MGMIDKNMAAVFLCSFGPIAEICDVEDFFAVFGVKAGTARRLLTKFVTDTEAVIDPFTFQAMFYFQFPSSADDQHCQFLRSMSCSRCPRCFKWRQSFAYISTDGRRVSTNCFICRKEEPCHTSHIVFMRFELPLVEDISADQMKRWVRRACRNLVNCARELDMPYKICFAYTRPSRSRSLDLSREEGTERLLLVKEILCDVEQYKYTFIGDPDNRLRYRCCQAKISHSSAPISSEHHTVKRRRREKRRIEDCRGSIDILRNEGQVFSLTATHNTNHEAGTSVSEISPEIAQLVQHLANTGLTPAQILHKLRTEGHVTLKWSAVHYRWLEAVKKTTCFMRTPLFPRPSMQEQLNTYNA